MQMQMQVLRFAKEWKGKKDVQVQKQKQVQMQVLRFAQEWKGKKDVQVQGQMQMRVFPFGRLRARMERQERRAKAEAGPCGMTARKARAKAKEEADSRGNDRKKGKSKGKRRSRFPEGMTERKARAKAKEQRQERRSMLEFSVRPILVCCGGH
jgi:hypothetical protein